MANEQLTTFATITVPAGITDTIRVWRYSTANHALATGTYTDGSYALQTIFSSDMGHTYDLYCATLCTVDLPFVSGGETFQAQRTLLTSIAAYAVYACGGGYQSPYEALQGTIVLEPGYAAVYDTKRGYVFRRWA